MTRGSCKKGIWYVTWDKKVALGKIWLGAAKNKSLSVESGKYTCDRLACSIYGNMYHKMSINWKETACGIS